LVNSTGGLWLLLCIWTDLSFAISRWTR